MILQKRFTARVLERLDQLSWNRARLAREMGVQPPYLSNYLNGRFSPGLDVVEKFANALQIDAGELLQEHSLHEHV